MPASENLAKFARSFLGLKTIPEHAILKVEGRAAPIKEYVQQFKEWLLQESQKPGTDPNYAKLFEIIPFVDGNGASIDTKWGKFIKETLNPFIAEDNRQKKEKKKTKAVNAVVREIAQATLLPLGHPLCSDRALASLAPPPRRSLRPARKRAQAPPAQPPRPPPPSPKTTQ